MEKETSPIKSASVSLQTPSPRKGSTLPLQGEPWNILICGDFGFSSEKPQRVHVSEWNDFMTRNRVMLSGNVPDCLSGVDKQIFVDYPVESMRDFSAPAVEKNAAVLAPFRDGISALDDLLDGKITPDRAGALIERSALPIANKRAFLGLLGKKASPASAPLPPATPGNSRIDSVLAMIDMPSHGEETGTVASVSNASSALFAAVTEGSAIIIPRQELRQQRENGEAAVKRQVEQIVHAEFFARRYASWFCLKQITGLIGRTKGITVSVFSRDHESLADSLAQALRDSSEQGLAQDILLIDDEYGFSNADILRLETIAKAASDGMCSVVASLDTKDALFNGIDSRDTLAQFFDDVRFIPFKKLRSNPLVRCLALCGPRIAVGGEEPVVARAGWRVLFAWVNAFLTGQSLFDFMNDQGASPIPMSCAIEIPLHIVNEAAAWGLTLFGSGSPQSASIPVATLVDGEAAGPAYSCFGYNCIVNRIAKLVVQKATAVRESGTGEDLTGVVKTYLVKVLAAYEVLSSEAAVSVEADGQNSFRVTVDSEKTVCGHPLNFSQTITIYS